MRPRFFSRNPFLVKPISFICSLPLCVFLTSTTACGADGPESPVVLSVAADGCSPVAEICGDGLDQDCNGSDLPCSGSDADSDGYAVGADCDDSNRNVYPGISVACSGGCGAGTQTCQNNGSFTNCSCEPLCEALGSGKCYYVSAANGSASNVGSFAAPWKSYTNFVSYYDDVQGPSNKVSLKAGDVVYFMTGVYSDTYDYNGTRRALFLRGAQASSSQPIILKPYPGHKPIIEPNQHAEGIYILQSSGVIVEGFEVRKAWQSGVRYEESQNVEGRNLWVHDTDGNDADNIAGVHSLDVSGLNFHHSLIHDNYDRTNVDSDGQKTENSRNMVLFTGGNAQVHHNVFFQSPAITDSKTGGCITYKHASNSAGSTFEVSYNTFRNCFFTAIGSGTSGTRIHHNLIINSDPITFRDFGGRTRLSDNVVEYNTIIGGTGLTFDPTAEYEALGTLTFQNNIVVDSGSYGQERGMILVHPYGSDSLYDAVVGAKKLIARSNCYYNENTTPMFSLFASSTGDAGSQGGVLSLGSWQELGFDTESLNIDPRLSGSYISDSSSCSARGAFPQ